MSRRGVLLFLAMSVIWGIPYLLIKVAVAHLNPAVLVFLRTGMAAAILVPLSVHHRRWATLWPAIGWIGLYTVVEVAVPWWFLSSAERVLTSSLAGILVATVPIIGAALAAVTHVEAFTQRRILGLGVGLGGVAVLTAGSLGRGSGWPVLEVGIVAVGYAIGPLILSRRLSHWAGLDVMAVSLALSALLYLPAAWAARPAAMPDAAVLASVGILGLVCTALAFVAFFALIHEVGPVRATLITYVIDPTAKAGGLLGNRPR